MVNNILISIVIPCYNDAQYIEQSVLSALNQTYPNIEVIVIDDGSNAETKRVLKKLEHQIAKLITQENQGQSTARNVGIREAKGDYILTLDSDDYFEPSFCEKAIQVFFNKRDIKIVTCHANLLFEDGSSDIYIPTGGNVSSFIGSNAALGTSLFKKIDWNISGGYDQSMRQGFEDWEFFIRVLKSGGFTEVIQEPLYNYRKRTNSTTLRANAIKYDLLKYIYIKNQGIFIDHFEGFVSFMLNKIEREHKEKLKFYQKIDFKVGQAILKPIRFLKNIFKNQIKK